MLRPQDGKRASTGFFRCFAVALGRSGAALDLKNLGKTLYFQRFSTFPHIDQNTTSGILRAPSGITFGLILGALGRLGALWDDTWRPEGRQKSPQNVKKTGPAGSAEGKGRPRLILGSQKAAQGAPRPQKWSPKAQKKYPNSWKTPFQRPQLSINKNPPRSGVQGGCDCDLQSLPP